MNYQHNSFTKVTKKNYEYVREYKKQLLENITCLLNDLGIRFVIAYGNLIEYRRGKPIYHDDDLDIRFFKDDISKWHYFCKNCSPEKYNLSFDWRFPFVKQQMKNGITFQLVRFLNKENIEEFPHIKIYGDLVCNIVSFKFWTDYDIDFDNLEEIIYLDVKTFAPNANDSHRVLTKDYGPNYLEPLHKYEIF